MMEQEHSPDTPLWEKFQKIYKDSAWPKWEHELEPLLKGSPEDLNIGNKMS
jgi:hypothetical protein